MYIFSLWDSFLNIVDEVKCLLFTGMTCLVVGLPVFIVFLLKWDASAEFERNSTITSCKVVDIDRTGSCYSKNGSPTSKYTYTVETPFCDDTLIREDDHCTSNPLSMNTTKECKVLNDCSNFKWNHNTVINRNSAFVGLAFISAGVYVCMLISVVLRKKCRSKSVGEVHGLPIKQVNLQESGPDPPEWV
eukprot:TRINITY_DN4101_c1_g4_i1.p1 TRINITY_DN4101_c1_g4~~TRINITY_DN4101_c1_g4_i1.p1  ORF type:complete len:189 (+),score=26.44 TRINITY_DN4101_c1_g4_i1:57-623(+)